MRILLLSLLLVFTNFGLADGPAPGATDPIVVPADFPSPPGQATKQTCDSHGEELFQYCRTHLDNVIAANTSILGSVPANMTENAVDAAEGGAAVTQQAAAAQRVQAGICQRAVDQCVQVCEQARDNHIARNDTPGANEAIQNGRRRCGAIQAVVADANINASSLDQHANAMNETADSQRGAGGMGGMMGPLLGAGAALGAMCLMGRGICEGDDDEDDGGGPDGPATEDDIDCNKAENHMYAKCEQHFINLCQANTNGTGCNEFNNLYCGMNLSVASTDDEGGSGDGQASVNDELPMVTEDSGVGSTYCQYQVSVDYCKDTDMASCPSCRQLEQSRSPVCQNNPATCLPGWTQTQLQEAKNYCPTDPMFMTADTGGGSDDEESSTGGATTDTGGGTTAGGGTTGGGTTGGLPTGSGGTNAGTGDGQPDTASLDKIASTGNTSAGTYGSSGTFNPYGDLATYSVGYPYGPSLFANSSEVYNEKCAAGLIDNCGPREGLGAAPSGGSGGTN